MEGEEDTLGIGRVKGGGLLCSNLFEGLDNIMDARTEKFIRRRFGNIGQPFYGLQDSF